jgi:TonB-linked SusC/RagA family outer membrane protein
MYFKLLVRPVLAGLFACVFALSLFAQAQNKTITGKVVDSKDGSALAGVSVVAKGTNTGTQTGADGTFRLTVPSSTNTLVVSYIGFTSQEFSVRSATNLSVSLVSSSDQLGEVVVVGYGTRKLKDATGSVAVLTEKSFNKGVISSPEQLLQGRTPGVTVITNSGEPGAAVSINIRGTASIRSNNNPLFVVDGVPLDGGGLVSGGIYVDGCSSSKNPLSFINPNDIESISILKDASSAAIYGARGANGVVLITTKSGKGRGSFQFTSNTSVSTPASRYDLLNAQDFIYGVRQAVIASGADPAGVSAIDKGASTNWQDQILRTAVSQNFNLGWGFSRGGTSLRVSGSYDLQNGIIEKTSMQRGTIRANFSQKIGTRLKLDAIVNYTNLKNNYAAITNNAGYQGSLIGATIAFNPTYPIYNPDGTFFDPGDGNRNPVQILNMFKDYDVTNRWLNNFGLTYNITSGLAYKFTFGYDHSLTDRQGYADPRLGTGSYSGTTNIRGKDFGNSIFVNGRANDQNNKLVTTLFEHTLTYDKSFSNGHVLNMLGGFSYQKFKNYYWATTRWGTNMPNGIQEDMGAYKNATPVYGDTSQVEIQSVFARANYTINNKYYFTGTVRMDGSSKFSEGNKYATFPAFAFKWKVLGENFGANTLGKIFSQFDLRANWGITGNQEFPAYASLAIKQQQFNGSTTVISNSNPNLRWEQTTTTGVGVDMELFNGRLRATLDYYRKDTKDLLFLASYPQPAASANRWVNLPGIVRNTGFEVALDYQAIKRRGDGFAWDIAYNMTFMKNRVMDFGQNVVNTGEVSGQGLSGAYAQTIVNNYPLYTFKMPVFLRYDHNGFAVYANGSQDALLGSALPTFTAGLTNNFSMGRWNASVFFNAVRGFYVYNNTANALFLMGSLKTAHNVTYDVYNSIESPINPGSVSTRFLEKGDFIRLANASLSYTFLMKNPKVVKSLMVSLSGQNLALWTDYSGLDPEINVDKARDGVPSRGFDYTAYPRARTYTLGINVGF